jgi:hypothetical protein
MTVEGMKVVLGFIPLVKLSSAAVEEHEVGVGGIE